MVTVVTVNLLCMAREGTEWTAKAAVMNTLHRTEVGGKAGWPWSVRQTTNSALSTSFKHILY